MSLNLMGRLLTKAESMSQKLRSLRRSIGNSKRPANSELIDQHFGASPF